MKCGLPNFLENEVQVAHFKYGTLCQCSLKSGAYFCQMLFSSRALILYYISFQRFYCRLYLYPLKVLTSCGFEARYNLPTAPFYFFLNPLLWGLFIMDLWWFQYIALLLIRVISGHSGLEDTREKPEMANGKLFENSGQSAVNHGKFILIL